MRNAIIDVSSNTICIVIYDIENGGFKEILSEKFYANLSEYVDDEKLSADGISQLVYSLEALYDLCKLINCGCIKCFAVSSFEFLKNGAEIKSIVKEKFNFEFEILSTYEETLCDYYAIANSDVNAEKGIGYDLGNKSCRIFTFNAGVEIYDSFHMGSHHIYKKFVGRNHILPTKKSKIKISKYVENKLKSNDRLKNCGFDTIYAIGGSSRSLLKLYNVIVNNKKDCSDHTLTAKELSKFLDTLYNMGDKAIGIMCHLIPERIPTIIPALITINEICKYTGVKKIHIIEKSIRDGYLYKNISEAPD